MAFSMIYPKDIRKLMQTRRALLIDVRDKEAYRQGHLRNAGNLPYEEIEAGRMRLPGDRALILYCEYGSTSLMAARILGRKGYEVYTVVGGMQRIRQENLIDREK